MSTGDVLDPDVVDRLRQLTPPGEPDVLTDILHLFLDDVPRRIETLRAATAAGDATAVQRVAHSLKGSSGNIGARALYDVCRQLDDSAKSGDLARVGPLLDSLGAEYGRVEAQIKRLLRGS
jgi:HPt (histidine-containing phosphotransfer) domain-containing protein